MINGEKWLSFPTLGGWVTFKARKNRGEYVEK